MPASAMLCPRCRVYLLPKLTHCSVCKEPVTPGLMPDRTQTTFAVSNWSAAPDLPPVYVLADDYRQLTALTSGQADDRPSGQRPEPHSGRSLLTRELQRAIVCTPEELPDDVVTMNARVLYNLRHQTQSEARLLVYPEAYRPNGSHISVLTPLGAALLGLRSGQTLTFTDARGEPQYLRVERVLSQPNPPILPAG